jgi:hypothetical protein
MTRPSSIDQLPEEIRSTIGKLRQNGWTIDQIREHLVELYDRAPSRSALGRHIKGMDKIGERMRMARLMAEQLGRTVGDAKVSEAAQMNIELMNGTILELFMAHAEGEMDGIDEGGRAALAGNPKGIEAIAKAMDHLARASKSNTDLVIRVKREIEAEQQKKLDAMERAATKDGNAGTQRGFDVDTLRRVRQEIYGIAS